MTPQDLHRLLSSGRYRRSTEAALQEDVEALLVDARIPYRREHVLSPGDRVDFLVDGHIALELKTKCRPRLVLRQMERYAAHDVVTALVLLTGTAMGFPPALNGKPVFVVSLGRCSL